LLGVGAVGGGEGQVDAGLLRLVPERHECRGDGGVHDDRAVARIGGAVEGAQPHLDPGALVVGGGGAVVAGAVGTGQGGGRLREGGDVHAALGAARAFGDLPDVATRCDGGPAAVRADRCPGGRGDILRRHRGREIGRASCRERGWVWVVGGSWERNERER